MDTVLVTLDGSELSTHALPIAARVAAALGAQVVMLRVAPPPRATAPHGAGDLAPLVDLEERQANDEMLALQGVFGSTPVERVILIGGNPAAEIVEWLRQNPVDFVVMATHGRGGLRHLVAGSVTEAVLRSGLAPVIAVRPSEASMPSRQVQ